jgi:hypothetical protein
MQSSQLAERWLTVGQRSHGQVESLTMRGLIHASPLDGRAFNMQITKRDSLGSLHVCEQRRFAFEYQKVSFCKLLFNHG